MFDFGKWTSAFNEWLLGSGMADWLAVLIECVIIAVMILGVYTVLALFYILYERKLCAWFQCRLGPMRVGRWGLLQVFADMFKILIKELICLKGTDRFLFKLAPYLVITSSVVMLACLPWGNGLQIIDWNIGIFFVLAVSSVGVLGILLAGWSSNNKYTLIGAMRSGAQMVSYEISLGLAIMTIVVLAGTMDISQLVAEQADAWFLFKGHIPAIIAFIIYVIAATAETNRGPFDLPEPLHRLGHRLADVPRRLDAPARAGMGGIQPRDGLHPEPRVVHTQGVLHLVHHHLVQVDVPACAHRPAALVRMEIPYAVRIGQPVADDCVRGSRMAFLNRKTLPGFPETAR